MHILRAVSEQLFNSSKNFRRVRINSERNLLASSCLSVCLSFRPHVLAGLSLDVRDLLNWVLLRKCVEKLQILLKSDKTGHLHEDVSRFILLTPVGNVLQADNGAKGNHPGVSRGTLYPSILLYF